MISSLDLDKHNFTFCRCFSTEPKQGSSSPAAIASFSAVLNRNTTFQGLEVNFLWLVSTPRRNPSNSRVPLDTQAREAGFADGTLVTST